MYPTLMIASLGFRQFVAVNIRHTRHTGDSRSRGLLATVRENVTYLAVSHVSVLDGSRQQANRFLLEEVHSHVRWQRW